MLRPALHDPEPTTSAGPAASATAARMVGLDSLRGLAILAVIAFHVAIRFPPPGLVATATAYGYVGVQLFFVVSAISMCYMWDQRRGERAPVRSFLIRRLCRIAPPFWFGIAFYMAWRQLGFLADSPAGPVDVVLTATFLHGFVPSAINRVVPGGWSIAVEVGFYVLFPMMILHIGGAWRRVAAALAAWLCCTAAAAVIRAQAGPDIDLFLYYSLLTQLPVFIVGMAIYSVGVKGERPPLLATLGVVGLWFALALAARALGWPGRPGLWLQVALLGGFAAVVIGRFESRWLAFAGRFSYSAYLFHFAVLDLVSLAVPDALRHGLLPFAGALAATCLGTAAIAWVSSRTLEAWSIAYGRALVRRVNGASALAKQPSA